MATANVPFGEVCTDPWLICFLAPERQKRKKKNEGEDWLACSYRSETMRKQKLLPERKNKKPIRLLFFCFLNQEENEDSGRWRNLSIICLFFFLVLFELVLEQDIHMPSSDGNEFSRPGNDLNCPPVVLENRHRSHCFLVFLCGKSNFHMPTFTGRWHLFNLF